MKHLNIPLPDEMHKELRFVSVELEQSVAEIVRRLVVAFLKESKADKRLVNTWGFLPTPETLAKAFALGDVSCAPSTLREEDALQKKLSNSMLRAHEVEDGE